MFWNWNAIDDNKRVKKKLEGKLTSTHIEKDNPDSKSQLNKYLTYCACLCLSLPQKVCEGFIWVNVLLLGGLARTHTMTVN